jgi:pimeloyl-ACP methyl ester carboxylesterase
VKRRWRITFVVVAALAALLAVNAYSTSNQTKEAEVTVDDGRILNLSRGDVQVTDSGEPAQGRGQPIVLIHCYTCSLRWFDLLEPILAENHRVIRIDLLGHGGSEKPESGYDIPTQAAIVAEALNELGVQGALVAGNSMGAMVTASLAEQASQLVDRAVVIDMAPNTRDFGDGLPFTAKLGYVPVLGQALWRTTPSFVLRRELEVAFAPGFDVHSGFDEPDTPLDDLRAMTYTAYDEARARSDDYVEEMSLDQRFTAAAVPLMVIFGAEDQIFDAQTAIDGFEAVPGVQTEIVEGAGHAPQVEKPDEVAALLEKFSVPLPPASASDRRPSPSRRGDRRSKSRQRSDARRDGGRAGRERRPERRRNRSN